MGTNLLDHRLRGIFRGFLSFRSKTRQGFFARAFGARDILVDLLARVSCKSQVFVGLHDWELMGFLRFLRLIVHVDSNPACLLPSKSISYVSLMSLKLLIPEINECAFAKELVKLHKHYRSYLRFRNALIRMLVKLD